MIPTGYLSTAAVWTPNPDHPLTWAGFFALLVVILGIGTTLIGVLVAYGARGSLRAPRERPIAPVIVTTGVIVLAGLGVTVLGLWLY